MGTILPDQPPGKLKVINLWAGPGAGKSTTAAALFNLMKRERFSVELVTEVAKDFTYERAWSKLANQTLVFAMQEDRLRRLIGQVEYAIVDSPFPMGLRYASHQQARRLYSLISETWDDYDNFNFRLLRTAKPFQTFGRKETLEEAREADAQITAIFEDFDDNPDRGFPLMDPDAPDVEYQMLKLVVEAQGGTWPAREDGGL